MKRLTLTGYSRYTSVEGTANYKYKVYIKPSVLLPLQTFFSIYMVKYSKSFEKVRKNDAHCSYITWNYYLS